MPRQRNPPGAPTLSVSDFTGISVLLMTPYNSLLAVKAVFLKVRADERRAVTGVGGGDKPRA